MMFRNAYRRFSDGHESLLDNYTVSANSVAGIRWIELRRTQPGNWGIFQQSTYQPDTTWRWMGSIASDNQGNIALGFSKSSGTTHPGLGYTGRIPSDPLGSMESAANIFVGAGSQTGGLSRWGDYSSMSIDPSDNCTFWYTNEYIPSNGSFNWHTRLASFKFTACH